MDEFSKKFKEYESKSRKTNRNGIIIVIVGLLVFTGLFVYNVYTKKETQKDTEILLDYNNKLIKDSEIKDSIEYVHKIKREDSLKQVLQQVQTKINEIKSETGINKNVIKKIDLLQEKVNTIKSIARDTIIVRYYKRKADGNSVVKAIKSIDEPNFYLHYRDVPNDDGTRKVNALYYGGNVNKDYVDLLRKKLIENKVEIKYLKPFLSARGFEWKQDAMEIGFEKSTSTTNENAKLYIRIYCFKPNEKIKYAIRNKLEAKGFQVKLYPDWTEKPSFFSNQSTVLYYQASNKNKAIFIAKILTDLAKKMPNSKGAVTEFEVKMGDGYGVEENERKELFIIHYNGS
ncbi:hypothetical protein [Mariniflexile sp. HMF6888]|uniref:hypothetical protein n=1 Tax=Mariniflexile sp. HMF6888 TaxID=3373086 RepID=UPI0037A48CAB